MGALVTTTLVARLDEVFHSLILGLRIRLDLGNSIVGILRTLVDVDTQVDRLHGVTSRGEVFWQGLEELILVATGIHSDSRICFHAILEGC